MKVFCSVMLKIMQNQSAKNIFFQKVHCAQFKVNMMASILKLEMMFNKHYAPNPLLVKKSS